jgi:DNA-binding transcriptional regulator YiaG
MPNVGVLLKQEITRLSRREIRSEIQSTKKAAAQHRRQIAALKRQVTNLGREVALLKRRMPEKPPTIPSADTARRMRMRFDPKWLKARRARLGLSAADYGKLIGVSPQSIYNWEQGVARPRPEQIKTISAIHSIGKREAHQRLEQLATSESTRRRG